jgi:capsular exopolysaccharide synthesis family protein
MGGPDVITSSGSVAGGLQAELELRDYLQIFGRRKWAFLACFALVIAAAVAATVLQDASYRSTATVLVRTRETASLFALDGALDVTRSVAGEQAFLNGNAFQSAATAASPPETTVTIIADEASEDAGNRNSILFRATAGNGPDAAAAANAWAQTYLDLRHEFELSELAGSLAAIDTSVAGLLERRDIVLAPTTALDEVIASSTDPVEIARLGTERLLLVELARTELDALDLQIARLQGTRSQLQVQQDLLSGPTISARMNATADVPARPFEPNVARNLLLGGVAGLILAAGLVLLLETLDGRLATADDIGAAIPVDHLASIPKIRSRGVTHGVDEAYQRVLSGLSLAEIGNGPLRRVLVTSANEGEGKTTTSLRLASLSAFGGTRTLLIEADLYRPMATIRLDISNRQGLSDYLEGTLSLDEVIFGTLVDDNLDVIPSGHVQAENVIDLLRSPAMGVLMEKVSSMYDRVIIDSAPILSVADTVELAVHCDTAVMVVGAGKTSAKELSEAHRILRSSRIDTLGTVLVGASTEGNDVYSHGYATR